MAKNSITIMMVALIFFCSLSGCIDESSEQLELDVSELENENEEFNNTITTLRMENEKLIQEINSLNNSNNNGMMELENIQTLLDNANNSIIALENIVSQLNTNVSLQNQTIQLNLEVQLLQLQNQILEQNLRLQSLEYNNSLLLVNDEIENLQNLLDEANQIIFEYLNAEAGLMGDPANPLLFEQYENNGTYMNHANWNGGLWDRVIFDDEGIPLVQYHDGLKYVPTTAFHWGLVSFSKWIATGNQSNFDDAMEVAIWAVENQSETGGWGWFFNHSFHGGVLGDMYSGWYGGMTQGLGMSFLTRMYTETGNQSFKDAALNATELLSIPVDQGGVLRTYNGHSWYEEYPTPDAGSFVLNGYIYSLIGLYDLWTVFNSTEAGELYQNGTDSLYAMIGLFDLGCASSYDLVHHSVSGTAPNIAREGYHSLHITLISVMNIFENDGFQTVEDRWIEYAGDVCFSSPNGANPK
tara:strand:+ start:1982 stop:3388 length:1407 start_codon:yes stop_codon:yes gene_type:complete